jgi:uncharacterized lipoprotein YmbA
MLGWIVRGGLCGLLLFLNACASPQEHFYLLEKSTPEKSAVFGKSATVIVGPVVIPAEVDRPQIVVRKGPHEVAIKEQARWAVSLKEALPRMLAGELSRNVKDTRFVPIATGGYPTAKARLAIDITRFDVSYDAGASVTIHWVYQSIVTSLPPVEGVAVARSPVGNREIEGLLDSLRRATNSAAETIANELPSDP